MDFYTYNGHNEDAYVSFDRGKINFRQNYGLLNLVIGLILSPNPNSIVTWAVGG